MSISQWYETIICDQESDLSLMVISLPGKYVPDFENIDHVSNIADALGASLHCTLKKSSLGPGLAAAMKGRADKEEDFDLKEFIKREPEAYRFAEAILDHAWIPVENSPLTGEKLGQLAEKAPAAVGAGLGFYASGGSPILVFLLVPAGIIICCAAKGVGDGLYAGLKERVTNRLCNKRRNSKPKKKDRSGM